MSGILCIVIASDPLKQHFLLAAHPSNVLFKEMQLYLKEVLPLFCTASSYSFFKPFTAVKHLTTIPFPSRNYLPFQTVPCLLCCSHKHISFCSYILTCKERGLVIPVSSKDFLSALNCFFLSLENMSVA